MRQLISLGCAVICLALVPVLSGIETNSPCKILGLIGSEVYRHFQTMIVDDTSVERHGTESILRRNVLTDDSIGPTSVVLHIHRDFAEELQVKTKVPCTGTLPLQAAVGQARYSQRVLSVPSQYALIVGYQVRTQRCHHIALNTVRSTKVQLVDPRQIFLDETLLCHSPRESG